MIISSPDPSAGKEMILAASTFVKNVFPSNGLKPNCQVPFLDTRTANPVNIPEVIDVSPATGTAGAPGIVPKLFGPPTTNMNCVVNGLPVMLSQATDPDPPPDDGGGVYPIFPCP